MGKKKGKKKAQPVKTTVFRTPVEPRNPLQEFARQMANAKRQGGKPLTDADREAAGKRVGDVIRKFIAPPETVEKHLERLGMFYMVRPAKNADRAGFPAGDNLKQVLVIDYDTLVKVEAAQDKPRGALPEVYGNVPVEADPGTKEDFYSKLVAERGAGETSNDDFSEPLLPKVAYRDLTEADDEYPIGGVTG